MSAITVKQADLSEIDKVAVLFDLYRQFYGKEADLAAARQFLLDRFDHGESVIFIAYLNSSAVGFTQLYPSFSSASLRRIFILNDLYVIAEARQLGVASCLIERAKTYAQTLHAARLSLSTSITNNIAQKVYETNGWIKDEQFFVYQYPLD